MLILRLGLCIINKTKKATRLLKKNLKDSVRVHPDRVVFFFDESRFGTHSNVGHGWFIKGLRNQVPVKLGFENFYLYSAVAPKTGEDCTLLLPQVNTDCMNVFLEQLAQSFVDKDLLLVMDGAAWHRSRGLKIPARITLMYLPAYSPELNPVESLWRYLKDRLIVNRIHTSLDALEQAICTCINQMTQDLFRSICATDYLFC